MLGAQGRCPSRGTAPAQWAARCYLVRWDLTTALGLSISELGVPMSGVLRSRIPQTD